MTTTKQQIFEAARYFVNSFGAEPREGFIANELSAKVSALVEVSIEGRSKGAGVAIVRFKGEVVAHEFSGTFVEGEWIELLMAQYEVNKRLYKQVAGIPMWEALDQNAARTVRWSNERYTEAAIAAGSTLRIKKDSGINGKTTDEEMKANAALIAFAPDLLVALESLLDAHESYHVAAQAEVIGTATAMMLFEKEEIVIETRALIAKARGELIQ